MSEKKLNFRTIYNLPEFEGTNPGSEEENEYQLYEEEGVQKLKVTGKKNVQAAIQSHLEETDLHLIIQKLIDSGITPDDLHVSFTDDVVDCVVESNFHEMYKAVQNKDKNEDLIKKYEEKIKALEAEKKVAEEKAAQKEGE